MVTTEKNNGIVFDFDSMLNTANGTKEIYNYNGVYLSKLVDTLGDTQKARKKFRKVLDAFAVNFAQCSTKEQKTAFCSQFWAKFGDCFNSRTICHENRAKANKNLALFADAVAKMQ